MYLVKVLLIVLHLLLSGQDSYQSSLKPDNWRYLANTYGDEVNDSFGEYGRVDRSILGNGEFGRIGDDIGSSGTGASDNEATSACGNRGSGGSSGGDEDVCGNGNRGNDDDSTGCGSRGSGEDDTNSYGNRGSGSRTGGDDDAANGSRGKGDDDGGLGSRGYGSDSHSTSAAPGKNSGNRFGGRNLKQTATGFALKAAQEAKAANDGQIPASDQVKCDYATKAIHAAKAAEAVLAGKQDYLAELRQELLGAETEVATLTMQLPMMQENADSAANALRDGQAQLIILKAILQAATNNVCSIQNVAKGAQQELAEKTQILSAAQHRADNIARQMTEAKTDFDKTKVAAYKAVCAAVEAKQKAQRSRRMSWM